MHLQSGNGTDDVALVRAGVRSVVGVDFSEVAARAAQRRATDLGSPCRSVVAVLPGAPLATAIADLVDTGKGALIWMPDLARWAQDAAPLWSWDADEPRIRADRSYSFALLARRTTVVERVPEDRERAS